MIDCKKHIFITFFLIVFIILLFAYTNIDEYIQNFFYDFQHHKWILDRNLQPWKFIFYDGIKKILIFIGVLFLFVLFTDKFKEYKKGILVVLLSGVLVPIVIGGLKKATNMPCPKNRIEYGGIYPKTKVWEHYPKNFHAKRVKCWPAGHASGGFALMSLFFLFKIRKNRYIGLGIGIVLGWLMGIYKMLIGDHFLSHTMLTMEMAWFIIVLIACMILDDRYFERN
ncbi:MAG: phosphatase PAP2 family protein [Nautiliaceae bacterium]